MAGIAERIVLDGEVLERQVRELREAAQAMRTVAPAAGTSIGGSAFGALNAFLVGPLNGMASRSAELVGAAGELADRMASGVGGANAAFSAFEEQAAAALAKLDVDGRA